MRLSIIVMIVVLVVGTIVISFGYITNQDSPKNIVQSDPYEKLQNYKKELEKINQYNQKLLSELEDKLIHSDNSSLAQLTKRFQY